MAYCDDGSYYYAFWKKDDLGQKLAPIGCWSLGCFLSEMKEYVVVQQFTGLLDKNKKEIYEGDILSYDGRDGYGLVAWDDDDGSYYLEQGSFLSWIDIFSDSRRWYRTEVEGNIFENANLLG